MPTHTLIRIAALLLTVLFAIVTRRNPSVFGIWVLAAGFSHYFMALLLSRRAAKAALGSPGGKLAMLGLIFGGAALYLYRLPIVQYFGIHHAFNEVYMLDRTVRPLTAAALRRLRTAAVALHGFAYLFVLRNNVQLDWVNPRVALLGLAVSTALFCSLTYRARALLSRTELIDNASGELLALLLVAASLVVRISFLQIVAYHFVFWFLYPIPKLWRDDRAAIYKYVGLTGAVLAVALLCSPIGVVAYSQAGSLFAHQFTLWSHVHITLSFALSSANPSWILARFRPQVLVAEAVSPVP